MKDRPDVLQSRVVDGSNTTTTNSPESSAPALPVERAGRWCVLTVPLWGACYPRRAGEVLCGASWWATLLRYAGIIFAIAAIMVTLLLWNGMYHVRERMMAAAQGTNAGALEVRTVREVWAEWQAGSGLGLAERTVLWTAVLVMSCAISAVGLHLTTLSPRRDFVKAANLGTRVVPGGGGLLILLVGAFGFMIVLGNVWGAQAPDYRFIMSALDPRRYVFILAPAALSFLLYLLGVMFRGALPPRDDQDEPPLCEGCGYDLTHKPSDGRCPECGMRVEESLTPGLRRPGSAWQRNKGLFSFLQTTIRILRLGPKAYESMRARNPDSAIESFGRGHYLLIGVAAALWVYCCFRTIPDGPPNGILFMFTMSALTVVPLAGWVTHRFVGAVVTAGWMIQGMLDRPHVVSTVHAGETVFLWVFCLYNGVLITSYALFDDWIAKWLGRAAANFFLGTPPEGAVLLVGSGLLILFWMRRYHRCLSAARWANY
ncbi:MAG: hypothetical protein J5J06_07350 [Phycisphaerae bacterium]|nr:hypothetical protein [Phycisphaerae bacterium]